MSGSRTPTQISQIPGAVWVIDKEMLQQQTRNGADLKTALGRLVPGLDLAPQGRTNYGQNMRGRGVQVLIDGVSLNGSRSLSRQFDAIDPFNIERVEVLSGASSLYGGGATGGLINIITRKGEEGLNWRTEAGITSGFNNSDDIIAASRNRSAVEMSLFKATWVQPLAITAATMTVAARKSS